MTRQTLTKPARRHRRCTVGGRAAAVATAVIVTLALLGCGGGGGGEPAVAWVRGSAITESTLTHWTHVEQAQSAPSSRIPLPDPPSYRRCIAATRAALGVSKASRRLSHEALRKRCATLYVRSKEKALAFLITAEWLQGEAAEDGISVSRADVEATYRDLLNGPAGHGFARSLRSRGMSTADELLQLRLAKLAQKLRAAITGAGQHRVNEFIAAYRRRWRQRTTCRAGFVVAECSNGPPLPSGPSG
jgi:hypothetical protein